MQHMEVLRGHQQEPRPIITRQCGSLKALVLTTGWGLRGRPPAQLGEACSLQLVALLLQLARLAVQAADPVLQGL